MNIIDHIYACIQARFVQPWMQSHFEKTKYGRQITAYKSKYKGKRCFIIANGPSLCTEDLNLLYDKGEITFAMNRIYKLFPDTRWRPTFYVCEDEMIAGEQQSEINAVEAKEKFIPIEIAWWHNIVIDNACYFHLNYNKELRSPYGFSADCAHQIDCRGTVTCTCMQLAAYMGFQEIYLLGVDHNYRVIIDVDGNVVTDNSAKDYFCDNYDSDIKDVVIHDMGNNTRAYLDAKAYCDSTQGTTTIYNATRGGKLEIFQRVSLDEILEQHKQK